jgi:hypothetical protein
LLQCHSRGSDEHFSGTFKESQSNYYRSTGFSRDLVWPIKRNGTKLQGRVHRMEARLKAGDSFLVEGDVAERERGIKFGVISRKGAASQLNYAIL